MGKVAPPVALAALTAPAPIRADHDLAPFDCGAPALNDWLRRRSLRNHRIGGASRTYVVARGGVVVGYYSLTVGAVSRMEAVKGLQRNMPEQLPIMLLGRMAVDLSCAGNGIGSSLLRDAVRRTMQVAEAAGLAALVVHAKDEAAAGSYLKHGFHPSPLRDLTLMISGKEVLDAQPA